MLLKLVERSVEPWRMHRRLARVQRPCVPIEVIHRAWRAIRSARRRAPREAVTVALGSYRLAGHNANNLVDLFEEIFVAEVYDAPVATATPFILDCGANVGVASMYFKLRFPDSHVLAFEPNPACVALWRENIVGNGLTNAEVVEAALGGTEGEVDLYFSDVQSLGGSIVHRFNDSDRTRRVRVVRLSTWIDRPVDLLKLDVEGAEHDVLDDLVASGAIAQVRRMIVEYHHRLASLHGRLAGFLQVLERSGFTYRLLSQDRGGRFDDDWQGIMIYATRPELAVPTGARTPA